MADYRLLLADFPEGTIIGELPVVDCDFELSLDASGRLGATIPLDVDITSETLAVARTSLFLERDSVILWGGILWRATADVGAGTVALEAEGFHSYFERRFIRADMTATDDDQLDIARAYLSTAQATGDVNVDADTVDSGIIRTRVHAGFERKPVAEAFEQLAAVEDGFDWYYTWSRSSGIMTPKVQFQYPASGRITDLVFELGKNCTGLTYSEDGTGIVNRVDALGAGEGADRLIATASNAPLIGPYPLLEDIVNVSDVLDTGTLYEHARRRLMRGAGPVKTIAVSTVADIEPAFGSYIVGDRVTVRGHEGWLDFNGRFRIVQLQLRLTEGGEDIVVTLVDVAVFDAL